MSTYLGMYAGGFEESGASTDRSESPLRAGIRAVWTLMPTMCPLDVSNQWSLGAIESG